MRSLLVFSIVVALPAAPALADWNVGDPHKMHFPQLPDPNGWDVKVLYPTIVLADDFQCSATGPITDIHFWASWKGDVEGFIPQLAVGIFSDIPASQSPTGYSMPGDLLWLWDNAQLGMTKRLWGEGYQGWYNPATGQAIYPDHHKIWQYNILLPPGVPPFVQEQGKTYWLGITAITVGGELGWKTSLNHWNDDAIWTPADPYFPRELRDPYLSQISLDLAFVITPEPATTGLVALGASLLLRRRRSL